MSLAERLQEAREKTKPRFEQWIDTLDDEDREALFEAAASGMSSTAITIAIRAAGGSVSKETIDVWRRTIGKAG
ncbi:hypothetical protein [Agromyces sp. NBRC 114283]|uniref:hypothetical protein n=1 Tax=Agromyces sp. NBRC 114283 TaxID=2994521 RepID=UPI0024A3CA67|nr:hypothetical protein [Agromyces sp. NBRC 114283]GLU88931.1 hypothetical protein Agsp01_11860 [Agromyces sp. NBRC 114283]